MSPSAPISLSAIPTLADLYAANEISAPSKTHATPNPSLNAKISLIRTDITTLAVSSIVNAANTSLLGGGGVDGAIHRAAGPGLLRECRTLGGCETGLAKMTDAYDLPCEKVMHAVGPIYDRDEPEESARLLAGCYRRSLDLMVEAGLGSIAFSALSTGVYGYPSQEAAEVAVRAVRGWLDEDEERAGGVGRVVFCAFLERDEKAYEGTVPRFFPPAMEEGDDNEATGDATTEDKDVEKADAAAVTKPDGALHGAGDGRNVEAADGASDSKKNTQDEGAVPDLPDVPTNEPKEPGQPEHKKLKLNSDEAK